MYLAYSGILALYAAKSDIDSKFVDNLKFKT